MNFGSVGVTELVFVLLAWALPLALMVWFIRTLSSMARSLRDIADRLVSLENTVRDGSPRRVP
jgi:hypothetical protein